MNETTIHGNLTANPVVHTNPQTGKTATTFDLAVNSRWYDRGRGHYVDRPPVFHRVVCFGDLAGNAAASLKKGMTVTVTGSFADDSYTPQGTDKPIRRIRLEAADVAVSLRWAVAAVARKTTPADPAQHTPQAGTAAAADAADQAVQAAGGQDSQPAPEPEPAPATRPATRRAPRPQSAPEPVAA